MHAKNTKYRFWQGTLRGSTMIELLVVMLVAGIVFLMAFEGLSIIRQYSSSINRKLMQKTDLLYSHQVFETLMEQSDSIQKDEQHLIFYSNVSDVAEERLAIDSTSLLLQQGTNTDILFPGLIHIGFHYPDRNTDLIDSIFIAVKQNKDTLYLDYGLSSVYGIKLSAFSE